MAIDRDYVVVACNPACTLLSGYVKADVVGVDIRTVAHAPLRAFIEDAFEAAAVEKTLQRDVTITRKDGTTTLTEATSVPVVDAEAAVHLFIVLQDASWRQEAEQRFRSLFDRNPIAAAMYDADGLVVAVNAAGVEQSGYPQEHFIGQPLGCHTREEHLDALRAAFALALRGQITHAPAELQSADGAWQHFEVTFIPRTEGGQSAGVYALYQNITPLTRTTEELGQERLRFQLLFEHNPAVVVAVDLQQRIVEMNPAGVRVSGYGLEKIRGHNVGEFVPPSQRDTLRRYVAHALKGETVSFPIDAYSADGRIIQYQATALPMLAEHKIVGAYGLLENVTERMRAERTVAAQREEIIDLEHDFKSLFANNPDGICLLATDGVIIDMNEEATLVARRAREQVLGQNFRVFLQGLEIERAWSFFRRALDGETVHFEIQSTRGDGSELHLDAAMFPKYAQGLVVGIYCAFKDITDRKVVHRKLEMQAQRMRDLYLLATIPEYTDAHVMSTLQTGCRLLGLESGAIVDSTDGLHVDMRYDSLQLFAGNDERVIELAKAVLTQRDPVSVHVGEPGELGYGTWIGSRLLVGGTLHGVLLFFSRTTRDHAFEEIDLDTTALMAALVASALERRRSRTHLRTLAYYDALTGLPNRLAFQERVRDAILDQRGHARPLAILYFDLDRFKDINDTLGHAMGDRFLQMVAHRLAHGVGEGDVVARMGGDEFIVLLRDIESRETVERAAAELLRAIEDPFRIEGYEQFIATSIGVAMSPEDGRDDQSLIKHADIAMYRMKDQGGNGYLFYDSAFEAPLRTRLTEEKHLRRAIERDQFVLHYQPIVDVKSQQIVSVEALVRWNHPQRGLVYPDDFIPVAEASGLIMQLGEWVVTHGAAQVLQWPHNAPLALAVNISARQFHHPNLCDRLLELIVQAGFDPSRVEIEITESMALSDVAHSIDTVRQLKRIGATIAVDDFGTGHSSLSYLRRFDVDHLKIDRSFVAGIGTEPSDETIVKAIVAMGHSLGLVVVAEGVENRQQFEFLRVHGCDRVQGYLFSPPVDAEGIESLLASWRGVA